MTSLSIIRGAVCAAAIISAGAVSADVTAADVWTNWQESLAIYGQDGLTVGSEVMAGDTLTVSGIVMSMKDDVSDVTMTLGDLAFTENGDGTVSIAMAPSYPIQVNAQDGSVIKMSVTQSGMTLTASGTPSAMSYDITADQYGISIDEISEDGAPLDADIRLIANNVVGNYVVAKDTQRTMTYGLSAGSLDILADVIPPETPGDYLTFSGKLMGLSTTSTTTTPLEFSDSSPETLFAEGFAFEGGYSYQSAGYLFDVQVEGEKSSGTASTGAGTLRGSMSDRAVSYDSLTNDLAVNVQGGGVPFPIEMSLAQYGIGFEMPLGKTDEPADFGLRVNLTDLNVNDTIWAMADPAGALPRDPATLLLNLSGKAKLFFDLMDPEPEEAVMAAEIPGELTALTLNNLMLKLGGAELTGVGDFTFDNSDLETFDGLPRPKGEVSVNIKGANALVDSLVKMGLIPEDQAMMGRMMMGMFARTTGDDELTSKIEVNDQGHVIANGQRIQ